MQNPVENPQVQQQIQQKGKDTMAMMERNLKHGEEQLKHAAHHVERQLQENPWPVVTGIAVGCLLFGFIMGTARR